MAARSSTRREPQIELRRLTEDYCEFVLKNTDVSMANALRRIILVEVRRAPGWWVVRLEAAGPGWAGAPAGGMPPGLVLLSISPCAAYPLVHATDW